MSTRYTENTKVSIESTRQEIEDFLRRKGATNFGCIRNMTCDRWFSLSFKRDRFVRFVIPLSSSSDRKFNTTPSGKYLRTAESKRKAWEQDCKQRWRALLLYIKAKMEAVEIGISHFDEEFLAHIILPDGQTVAEVIAPAIEEGYRGGKNLPVAGLLGFASRSKSLDPEQ